MENGSKPARLDLACAHGKRQSMCIVQTHHMRFPNSTIYVHSISTCDYQRAQSTAAWIVALSEDHNPQPSLHHFLPTHSMKQSVLSQNAIINSNIITASSSTSTIDHDSNVRTVSCQHIPRQYEHFLSSVSVSNVGAISEQNRHQQCQRCSSWSVCEHTINSDIGTISGQSHGKKSLSCL